MAQRIPLTGHLIVIGFGSIARATLPTWAGGYSDPQLSLSRRTTRCYRFTN